MRDNGDKKEPQKALAPLIALVFLILVLVIPLAGAEPSSAASRANGLSVKIISPHPYSSMTERVLTDEEIWVNGTTGGSEEVLKVELSVEGGDWKECAGGKEWSVWVGLPEGMVTIEARATGVNGTVVNTSIKVKAERIDHIPPAAVGNISAEVGLTSGEVRVAWDPWPEYDYINGIAPLKPERASIRVYISQSEVKPTNIDEMRVYEEWMGFKDWENESGKGPEITYRDISNLINGKNYWFAVTTLDKYGNENLTLVENDNLISAIPVAPTEASNICLAVALPVSIVLIITVVLLVAAPGKKLKLIREKIKDPLRPYLYVAPAVLALAALTFYPVGYGFYISFTNMGGSHIFDYDLIGIDNYVDIFSDEIKMDRFWDVTLNTFAWTIVNVVLTMVIGLGLALLLNNKKLRGKVLYRTFLLLPWAMPAYISCLIWKGMFHHDFGAVNHMIGFFGIEPVQWLDRMPYAFWACVITNVWLGIPFMVMVFSGGLKSIPDDLYEAARVDGVSGWKQFRHITLPLLKPTMIPASLLSFIWTFNMFNVIYLVTGGGPGGKTDILITYVYNAAFEGNDYGFAAAYSVIIFFMLLSFSIVYMKISKAGGEEQ